MIGVREWEYYPIEMPVDSEGRGPATIGVDAVRMTYEVWDQSFNTYASFDNMPDAINEAMRLNLSTQSVEKKDFPFRRPRGSGNGEAALALRKAGYMRCPKFWVTKEQFELISYMMKQNEEEVAQIKNNVYKPTGA